MTVSYVIAGPNTRTRTTVLANESCILIRCLEQEPFVRPLVKRFKITIIRFPKYAASHLLRGFWNSWSISSTLIKPNNREPGKVKDWIIRMKMVAAVSVCLAEVETVVPCSNCSSELNNIHPSPYYTIWFAKGTSICICLQRNTFPMWKQNDGQLETAENEKTAKQPNPKNTQNGRRNCCYLLLLLLLAAAAKQPPLTFIYAFQE